MAKIKKVLKNEIRTILLKEATLGELVDILKKLPRDIKIFNLDGEPISFVEVNTRARIMGVN